MVARDYQKNQVNRAQLNRSSGSQNKVPQLRGKQRPPLGGKSQATCQLISEEFPPAPLLALERDGVKLSCLETSRAILTGSCHLSRYSSNLFNRHLPSQREMLFFQTLGKGLLNRLYLVGQVVLDYLQTLPDDLPTRLSSVAGVTKSTRKVRIMWEPADGTLAKLPLSTGAG